MTATEVDIPGWVLDFLRGVERQMGSVVRNTSPESVNLAFCCVFSPVVTKDDLSYLEGLNRKGEAGVRGTSHLSF